MTFPVNEPIPPQLWGEHESADLYERARVPEWCRLVAQADAWDYGQSVAVPNGQEIQLVPAGETEI